MIIPPKALLVILDGESTKPQFKSFYARWYASKVRHFVQIFFELILSRKEHMTYMGARLVAFSNLLEELVVLCVKPLHILVYGLDIFRAQRLCLPTFKSLCCSDG